MKLILSGLSLLLLINASVAIAADSGGEAEPAVPLLFSITASSGTYADGKLRLNGVPAVVWFTDRPERKAGHLTLEEFRRGWSKGSDSYKDDPPNAVLAIEGQVSGKEIVLVLTDLQIEGPAVIFKLKLLKGDIPASFDSASLFLDANDSYYNEAGY